MIQEELDVLVIGAGVVGAAIAKQLSETASRSIWVVDKHSRVAEGITSRNSGVIHSSLYYPPSSLKAKLCVRGQELLYEWVRKMGVPHAQTGKLVVAVEPSELGEIEATMVNALESGASGLSLLSQREVHALEPAVRAAGALFASKTGIVDPYALTKSFLSAAESRGTEVLTEVEVQGVEARPGGYRVATNRGEVFARAVINAAGLDSDRVGELLGGEVPKIYPCRGDYFYLRPAPKLTHLIYPAKKKDAPGLGIHVTLGLDGTVKLGPDAEYVSARDDFSSREGKREAFRQAVERYLGPLPLEAFHYDQCGIRPKLRNPSEGKEKDFYIDRPRPGWVNLVGIESPGLTSSLAIAEIVSELIA